MNKENIGKHCEEVEHLLNDKLPFMVRHGVTFVLAVILIAIAVLCMCDDQMLPMAEDILRKVVDSIKNKNLNIDG